MFKFRAEAANMERVVRRREEQKEIFNMFRAMKEDIERDRKRRELFELQNEREKKYRELLPKPTFMDKFSDFFRSFHASST